MIEQPLGVDDVHRNLTEKRRNLMLPPKGEQSALLISTLSEVEALAVWTVLDYPLPSRGNQELLIVLKAEKDRLGGWVVRTETLTMR
jgi:hypothetical protein